VRSCFVCLLLLGVLCVWVWVCLFWLLFFWFGLFFGFVLVVVVGVVGWVGVWFLVWGGVRGCLFLGGYCDPWLEERGCGVGEDES
jgi:hypothetical protein